MMIAGKTPSVATSNGTTAIQQGGNSTVHALTFWQAFQSFFHPDGASVTESVSAGMVNPNAGVVKRVLAALVRLHYRILSLATIRWSS